MRIQFVFALLGFGLYAVSAWSIFGFWGVHGVLRMLGPQAWTIPGLRRRPQHMGLAVVAPNGQNLLGAPEASETRLRRGR